MAEKFALTLKTMLSGDTLERLLATACRRPFGLSFEGSEDTPRGRRKIVRIVFEHPDDREKFRAQLLRLAADAPKAPAGPRSALG